MSETPIPTVTLRFFAAAEASMGLGELALRIPDAQDPGSESVGLTIAEALEAARRHAADDDIAEVFSRCSFLVNEVSTRETSTALQPGDSLDVLPPFAGG